ASVVHPRCVTGRRLKAPVSAKRWTSRRWRETGPRSVQECAMQLRPRSLLPRRECLLACWDPGVELTSLLWRPAFVPEVNWPRRGRHRLRQFWPVGVSFLQQLLRHQSAVGPEMIRIPTPHGNKSEAGLGKALWGNG